MTLELESVSERLGAREVPRITIVAVPGAGLAGRPSKLRGQWTSAAIGKSCSYSDPNVSQPRSVHVGM